MGLFGLWNYEDYLLHLFINSSFARKGLVLLYIYLITTFVRFHITMALSILLSSGTALDLIIPILISVLTAMSSDTLFQYISTHRPRYKKFIEYVISNYSVDNFIKWKRIILISILLYIVMVLLLFEITNHSIFVALAQTTISCIICDFLEQRLPQTWYNYIIKWWRQPQVTKFQTQLMFIDNYRSPIKRRHSFDENDLRSKPITKPVKLLPPKPPTPPLQKKLD